MTIYILIVTAIVSIIAFSNQEVMQKLIFNPYLVQHKNEWYRFITSGFIHADTMHLFFNMFVLFSFGEAVEFYYASAFPQNGTFYFIMLYVGALIISDAPSFAKHKNNFMYNALGASGAVSAVIFSAIIFNPLSPIYIFGIIKLPGVIVGLSYLIVEYYLGKKGGDHINHDAHLWGAIFGIIYTIGLKPTLALNFIEELTHLMDAF